MLSNEKHRLQGQKVPGLPSYSWSTWTSYLDAQCLDFLICKMGRIITISVVKIKRVTMYKLKQGHDHYCRFRKYRPFHSVMINRIS